MSYSAQADLSQDADFIDRVSACAATQDIGDIDPRGWSAAHIWDVAAAPGFADAYESALAGAVPNPGDDPAVIADEQILAAVQAIILGASP